MKLKLITLLAMFILLSMTVLANHDDINVKFKESYRIDEDITLYYNITLHQYDNISIIIQSEDLINYTCISIYSPSAVTVTFNNKICKVEVNDTGKYYVIEVVHNEVEPNEYVGDFKVKHKLPSGFSVVLLIISIILLIISIFFSPIIIIALLFTIGTMTSFIFNYAYLIQPLFIGIISFIFIGLIILIQQILFTMFK